MCGTRGAARLSKQRRTLSGIPGTGKDDELCFSSHLFICLPQLAQFLYLNTKTTVSILRIPFPGILGHFSSCKMEKSQKNQNKNIKLVVYKLRSFEIFSIHLELCLIY